VQREIDSELGAEVLPSSFSPRALIALERKGDNYLIGLAIASIISARADSESSVKVSHVTHAVLDDAETPDSWPSLLVGVLLGLMGGIIQSLLPSLETTFGKAVWVTGLATGVVAIRSFGWWRRRRARRAAT
jgi:hypothetical protein